MQRGPPKKRSLTERQAEGLAGPPSQHPIHYQLGRPQRPGRHSTHLHHPYANTYVAGPASNDNSTQGRNHPTNKGSKHALGASKITSTQNGNVGTQRDPPYTWIVPEDEKATLADPFQGVSGPYGKIISKEPPPFEGDQGEGRANHWQETAYQSRRIAYQTTSNDAWLFDPSQASMPYPPITSHFEATGNHGIYTRGTLSNGVDPSPSTSWNYSSAYWPFANTSHGTSHDTEDHTAFALANAVHFPPRSQTSVFGASGALNQQDGALNTVGQNLQSTAAEAYAHRAAVPMPQVVAPANGAASSMGKGRVSDYSSLANAFSAPPPPPPPSSSNLTTSSLALASNATPTQPILLNAVSMWRQLTTEGPAPSYRSDASLRDTPQSIVNDTLDSAAAPHAVPPPMGAEACDRMSRLVQEMSQEDCDQLVAELDLQSNMDDIARVLQETAERHGIIWEQ